MQCSTIWLTSLGSIVITHFETTGVTPSMVMLVVNALPPVSILIRPVGFFIVALYFVWTVNVQLVAVCVFAFAELPGCFLGGEGRVYSDSLPDVGFVGKLALTPD